MDMIERVARAIHDFNCLSVPSLPAWENLEQDWRDQYLGRARAAVTAMPGWEPIETAPRDGDDVLLYWPLHGLHESFSRTKIGYGRSRDGKGEWVWQDRAFRSYSEDPTHWMPLPAPPDALKSEVQP